MQELQEIQVRPLRQEGPLEEGMATHSSILAWRIPWTEKPGGLESMGLWRVGHNWSNLAHTHAEKFEDTDGVNFEARRVSLQDLRLASIPLHFSGQGGLGAQATH